jgi:hypothetical protein
VKKIIDRDSAKRICDIGSAAPSVDPTRVAAALGAESTEDRLGIPGNPVSLFRIRAELHRRLQSSGGRPSLKDAERRIKIPVSDAQWKELEALASSFGDMGFTPSAGQVASVLLDLSLPLAKADVERIRRELRIRATETAK